MEIVFRAPANATLRVNPTHLLSLTVKRLSSVVPKVAVLSPALRSATD